MKCIDLLKSYIEHEKLELVENEETIELIKNSIEQSIQPILYPVFNDKRVKKYYISWVVVQEQFLALQKEITDLFNNEGIDHFFFKGSVLCNIYDDPSIRTRGDIDVYIHPEDIPKAREILIMNGYEREKNPCSHHEEYFKNKMTVELHFNFFGVEGKKEWINYYIDPFKYTSQVDGNLYKLDDTEHFVYCLCHFAKHLLRGAGLRYILDFYYMLKNTNIDYKKLHLSLKQLDLEVLYNNVLNVIYIISNQKYDNMIEEDITYFIEYMEQSGIHGYGEDNEQDMSQGFSSNKVGSIFSKIFLTNKNYRIAVYPKLGTKWYLYPVLLIVHWFMIILRLPRNIKLACNILFKKNPKKELYKKLGI